MNKYIKEQLEKCRVAHIPPYDDDTTTIVIDKNGTRGGMSFVPNHYYVIEIDDVVLSPEQSEVLHKNWNGGIVPPNKCLKCECIKVMGTMVKVDGIGYNKDTEEDINVFWSGWLPMKDITVLKEI